MNIINIILLKNFLINETLKPLKTEQKRKGELISRSKAHCRGVRLGRVHQRIDLVNTRQDWRCFQPEGSEILWKINLETKPGHENKLRFTSNALKIDGVY